MKICKKCNYQFDVDLNGTCPFCGSDEIASTDGTQFELSKDSNVYTDGGNDDSEH